ncbi:toxin-antitoxin system, toxin component, RelE domain protein [Oribacterium sp. oral taxon 108 str. F0425]|nr:toxin-antitoxin system, toxin component, RelE domain protein [Oribacterium sp. oral taxon 108 str. F0425]
MFVRILYFFDEDEIIIATNGFVKKQQKTPQSEIQLAKQRRAIYLRRKESIR